MKTVGVDVSHQNDDDICVLVRTYAAGVWYGTVSKEDFTTKDYTIVHVNNARRIWKWNGAFTLSELSQDGVTRPDETDLAKAVPSVKLDAIEVIPMSDKAKNILDNISDYEI